MLYLPYSANFNAFKNVFNEIAYIRCYPIQFLVFLISWLPWAAVSQIWRQKLATRVDSQTMDHGPPVGCRIICQLPNLQLLLFSAIRFNVTNFK